MLRFSTRIRLVISNPPLTEGLARPKQPAAVLVTVKDKSLSDGLRPPLTVTARGGQRKPGRAKETRRLNISLDNNRLIQGGPFEIGNQVLISSHRKLLKKRWW